jgi:hypothetical protein
VNDYLRKKRFAGMCREPVETVVSAVAAMWIATVFKPDAVAQAVVSKFIG